MNIYYTSSIQTLRQKDKHLHEVTNKMIRLIMLTVDELTEETNDNDLFSEDLRLERQKCNQNGGPLCENAQQYRTR